MLETLVVDRAAYVDGSPIIAGLPPAERASVADRLDLSPCEQRVAVSILEDVLGGKEGTTRQRSDWRWNLAFARIAVGDFAQAVEAFRGTPAEPLSRSTVPTVFNLAMALWGESGSADSAAFARVLDYYDAEDDKEWLEGDPNKLQALAVAEWFGDRVTDATKHLADAEELIRIRRRRTAISCWSYTRVSAPAFHEHCNEIRRLFAGEQVEPVFMRRDDRAIRGSRPGLR